MSFVVLVFFIATANFGVGYAAAVFLRRLEDYQRTALPVEIKVPVEPEPEPELPVEEAEPVKREPLLPQPVAKTEEVPEEWLDMLDGAEEVSGFVDASIQVFKLEIGRYRDELIAVDDYVRACLDDPDVETISRCVEALKRANEDYLERQGSATDYLSNRQDSLGELAEIGQQLEDVLMDQAAQIETTVSNLDVLDFESNIGAGCRRLILEICKLLDSTHLLRDNIHESLLAVALAEDRLEVLQERMQRDALTGFLNRSGLEVLIRKWWRDDPNHSREASVALVDIDFFHLVNEEHGATIGDKVLHSFGQLLDDTIRKDRGYDVITRFDGQGFLIFFGDTGPRNATSGVERVRQMSEESSFEFADREIQIKFSAGVTDVRENDTVRTLVKRARKALRQAKRGGRNRTYLDAGDGPEAIEPPDYNVRGRVYRLSD